ncbi:unnamed protein product [Sphagnum balticum]
MPSGIKRQRGGGPSIEVRPLLDHSDEAEDILPDLRNPELATPECRMDGVELYGNMPINDDDRVGNTTERELPRKMLTLPVNGSSTNTFQNSAPVEDLENPDSAESTTVLTDSGEHSVSGRSSSLLGSSSSSTFGLSSIMNIAYRSTAPAKNIFIWTGETLYRGYTRKNIAKGFLWSLAITTMHYAGLGALNIPSGYCTLNYALVLLSGIIGWFVCIVGCILMSHMETHLDQQILFSITATTGVAAMHFTANGLLAHAVTVSRNKLAEIVLTRKKLWRTIAQKENAEAVARARSDFIASASHEIRTPLHHLQGYSDLLSQTELTEEGRMLLCAIQRATKTLSLSKLEDFHVYQQLYTNLN